MKKHTFIYLLFILLFLPERVAAQIPEVKYSFDTDMLMLRNTAAGDFRHHYDDYTQYAPAALMLGLSRSGYLADTSCMGITDFCL